MPITIFIPEKVAIAKARVKHDGMFITEPWLALIRQIADLMRRISTTGTRGGIVVTDDDGVAQVITGEMDTPEYDAGHFTGSGGTWDVAEPDVNTFGFAILGRMMDVAFDLEDTTVAGTPTELLITIPQGRTAAKAISTPTVTVVDNGATREVGVASVTPGGDTIAITLLDETAFANATAATTVRGAIRFEVEPLP